MRRLIERARPRTYIEALQDRAKGDEREIQMLHFTFCARGGSRRVQRALWVTRALPDRRRGLCHLRDSFVFEKIRMPMIMADQAERVLADKLTPNNRHYRQPERRDHGRRRGRPLRASDAALQQADPKRHFRVDKCFRPLLVEPHSADIQDIKTHAQLAMSRRTEPAHRTKIKIGRQAQAIDRIKPPADIMLSRRQEEAVVRSATMRKIIREAMGCRAFLRLDQPQFQHLFIRKILRIMPEKHTLFLRFMVYADFQRSECSCPIGVRRSPTLTNESKTFGQL